jgi:hypothetical protein
VVVLQSFGRPGLDLGDPVWGNAISRALRA